MSSLRATVERHRQAFVRFLARRPLLVTALETVLVVVLIQDAVFIDEPVSPWGFWEWIASASMAYVAVLIPILPRLFKRPARNIAVERLGLSLSPFLFAYLSRFQGGPWWLLWIGAAETIGFVTFTAYSTARDWRTHEPDPQTQGAR